MCTILISRHTVIPGELQTAAAALSRNIRSQGWTSAVDIRTQSRADLYIRRAIFEVTQNEWFV